MSDEKQRSTTWMDRSWLFTRYEAETSGDAKRRKEWRRYRDLGWVDQDGKWKEDDDG